MTSLAFIFRVLLFGSLLLSTTGSMASPTANLKKVGEAKLSVYFWDVYYSTLYSQSGKYQKESFPQALHIEYLRDIDAEDLLSSTKKEWQKLAVASASAEKWLAKLANIFPDIKKGDSITLNVNSAQVSMFYYNDKAIGEISDPEFGPNFLAIWLDPKASYPKVRNKLVGATK